MEIVLTQPERDIGKAEVDLLFLHIYCEDFEIKNILLIIFGTLYEKRHHFNCRVVVGADLLYFSYFLHLEKILSGKSLF